MREQEDNRGWMGAEREKGIHWIARSMGSVFDTYYMYVQILSAIFSYTNYDHEGFQTIHSLHYTWPPNFLTFLLSWSRCHSQHRRKQDLHEHFVPQTLQLSPDMYKWLKKSKRQIGHVKHDWTSHIHNHSNYTSQLLWRMKWHMTLAIWGMDVSFEGYSREWKTKHCQNNFWSLAL